MKLSTKCRYGMRAVIQIAQMHESGSCKRKDIAKSEGISDSYLENILIILKTNGIIKTTRGAKGGYLLAKKPADIILLEIVEALEGSLDLVDCVSAPDCCEKHTNCTTRLLWKEMSQAWQSVLSTKTLQDLLDSENQKVAECFSI